MERQIEVVQNSSQYRALDTIDGEPSGIFPRIHHNAALQQVQEFLSKMSEKPEFTGRIIFMSMFNDISW